MTMLKPQTPEEREAFRRGVIRGEQLERARKDRIQWLKLFLIVYAALLLAVGTLWLTTFL